MWYTRGSIIGVTVPSGCIVVNDQASDLSLRIEPVSGLSRTRSTSQLSSGDLSSWGKIRFNTIATKPASKTIVQADSLLVRQLDGWEGLHLHGVVNTISMASKRPINPDEGLRIPSNKCSKMSGTSRSPNPKHSAAATMNRSLRVYST